MYLSYFSPQHYNAPFNFPDLFSSYEVYLNLFRDLKKEIYRFPEENIVVFVTTDVGIDGEVYSIFTDLIRLMRKICSKCQETVI
jgi:site-specific DNA-methyltransferase (adenine-specific)/site-specific DNA-methyltransferase (cytosine-N4-specific)